MSFFSIDGKMNFSGEEIFPSMGTQLFCCQPNGPTFSIDEINFIVSASRSTYNCNLYAYVSIPNKFFSSITLKIIFWPFYVFLIFFAAYVIIIIFLCSTFHRWKTKCQDSQIVSNSHLTVSRVLLLTDSSMSQLYAK